jgi:hypothetical protein
MSPDKPRQVAVRNKAFMVFPIKRLNARVLRSRERTELDTLTWPGVLKPQIANRMFDFSNPSSKTSGD